MPVATAKGKKFTFPEGTSVDRMGAAIADYFSKQEQPGEIDSDFAVESALRLGGFTDQDFEPSPEQPAPTMGEKLVGAGEAALALGTGAVGSTVAQVEAGAKALGRTAQGLAKATTGDYRFFDPVQQREFADQLEEEASGRTEQLTRAPRTEQGREMTQAVSEALAPLEALAPQAQPALGALTRGNLRPSTMMLKQNFDTKLQNVGRKIEAISARKPARATPRQREIIQNFSNVKAPSQISANVLNGVDKAVSKESVANRVKFATKNNIDETNAYAFAGASDTNKSTFQDILQEYKAGKLGAAALAERNPVKEMGKTVEKRWNQIDKIKKDAGDRIDPIAKKTLDGVQVKTDDISANFQELIDELGAYVDPEENILMFKDPSIGTLAGPRKMLSDAWKVFQSAGGDGYQLHRVKRILDELVVYGKPGEGLSGKSEVVVKTLRKNIDGALDTISKEYDKVNTRYSDTVRAMSDFREIMKGAFSPDMVSNDLLGFYAREINQKSPVGMRMRDALDRVEDAIAKHTKDFVGFDDDVRTQALFNAEVEKALKIDYGQELGDELLSILPLEAARFSRGDRASVVGDVLGRIFRFKAFRGRAEERTLKALEKLVETR